MREKKRHKRSSPKNQKIVKNVEKLENYETLPKHLSHIFLNKCLIILYLKASGVPRGSRTCGPQGTLNRSVFENS